MAGPFPGMDPYLEQPLFWAGVHQRLVTYIGDAIGEVLPPGYVADLGERVYVVHPGRDTYPDVVVLQRPDAQTLLGRGGGGAAAVVASDPPLVVTAHATEIREVFVQILALGEHEQVVTVIEVLSPSNKTSGHPGRELYLTEQREILDSQIHLIEVDLLRRGVHTIAAPRIALPDQAKWDYLVCLHRAQQGDRFEVWPISVPQRLPRICVPLAPDDPDVLLDLQVAFDRCYQAAGYVRRVNYEQDPPVPLSSEDTAWADSLLREKGLRH